MFTLSEIITATGGKVIHGSNGLIFKGVCIDSRRIKQGDIFICIKGERYDGHNFAYDALNAGAEGIIISDLEKFTVSGQQSAKPVVIMTDNTLDALGDIAHFHRARFNIPLIGITGSNGKTTTKEITASILSTRFNTLKNKWNFNNLIGVPLSLFNLNSQHRAAVIEMGMNTAGEIKRLCRIAHPTIGIVTNVCEAHIKQFNSIRDIKKEKEELVKSLDKESAAILNCDDPLVYEMNRLARGRVITYGLSDISIVSAEDIEERERGRYRFTLKLDKKTMPVCLAMPGRHNIYNALSAAAAGMAVNIDIEDIKRGIEVCHAPPMRGEVIKIDDITIINDTYNANPKSVEAALLILGDMAIDGRKVVIFGDMLELGEISQNAHTRIGDMAAEAGIDMLITVGESSKFTAEEAITSGMSRNNVFICKDTMGAAEIACEYLKAGDYVLVKGSRGMRMEEVVDAISSVLSAA